MEETCRPVTCTDVFAYWNAKKKKSTIAEPKKVRHGAQISLLSAQVLITLVLLLLTLNSVGTTILVFAFVRSTLFIKVNYLYCRVVESE